MAGHRQSLAQTVAEFIKIATSIATERDLHRLLNMIVTSARTLTHSEGGRIYVLDNTKRNLYLEVAQNECVGGAKECLHNVPLAIGERYNTANICIHCASTGQLIKVNDVYRYSGFDFSDLYEYDRACHYRTKSLLTVPLRNHLGFTIGVLQLLNPRDPDSDEIVPFSDELDDVVMAFASQAAVALDNVQLIEENRHLIRVLEQTNQILEMENKRLLGQIEERSRFTNIVGKSEAMRRVFDLLKKVLDTDATVLLRGETGTGKELIAQAIHFNSRRKKREFVAQNCAAVPEGLLESELFGYVKGAFSGAAGDKVGLIEFADGGTLFLDEIGDMPIDLQGKLLRVLQEKEVRPLGGNKSRKVNVRVIAATHCDLQEKIRAGEFRQDLYYRLCVFPIELPPLRERKEDLPALLQHFIAEFSECYDKEIIGISPAAMDNLLRYAYPGNIRELRNVMERAVLMCDSGASILPQHLPAEIIEAVVPANDNAFRPAVDYDLRDAVAQFEAGFIERKLQALNWNQTKAAKELNISRRTLIDKMQRLKIQRPGERAGV